MTDVPPILFMVTSAALVLGEDGNIVSTMNTGVFVIGGSGP